MVNLYQNLEHYTFKNVLQLRWNYLLILLNSGFIPKELFTKWGFNKARF